MMFNVKAVIAVAAMAVSGLAANEGAAAQIDFTGVTPGTYTDYTEDGFVFDEVRIVNGNCDALSGKPCGAENDNETSTMTAVGGGLFDAVSLWFQFLGKGTVNDLTLTTDQGSYTFLQSVWGNNDSGQYVTLSDYANIFTGISYLTLSTGAGGNVRFDDILANPAPVPLPAAGLLLLGGLGVLGAVRRRRTS